jgi:mono/diheme cytochrome c family protein
MKHTHQHLYLSLVPLLWLAPPAQASDIHLEAAEHERKPITSPTSPTVERGKYLVTVLACNNCHTPLKSGPNGPERDMTRMLSGHPAGVKMGPAQKLGGGWQWTASTSNTAFAGPWGVSYAPNLTPDPETGLGAWEVGTFVKALQKGAHLGTGRPILPPMPAEAFGQLTESDLKAIFAYLKTIPPIKNMPPESQPSHPSGILPAAKE